MAKLGYFIYRNIGDGCLVSKYCNEALPSPLTECANRTGPLADNEFPPDPFSGEYLVTWIESVNPDGVERCNLTIRRKPSATGEIYMLEWHDRFRGEAMVFDGNLVGAYI